MRGLPQEQTQFLQELGAFLRQKYQPPADMLRDKTEKIQLCRWPLGVKGSFGSTGFADVSPMST